MARKPRPLPAAAHGYLDAFERYLHSDGSKTPDARKEMSEHLQALISHTTIDLHHRRPRAHRAA